jgi:putative membrane protein
MIMLAGSIAICAMILPGISGAFILVLLGLYPVILAAISQLQLGLLGFFAVGCAVGLIVFSHVLSWLLHKYHGPTLALLCGFLLGSLKLLWPWKQTVEFYTDSHGQLQPLLQQNLWPADFAEKLGQNPHSLWAAVAVIAGIGLVLLLEWLAHKTSFNSAKK